jgi:hypothetical protein
MKISFPLARFTLSVFPLLLVIGCSPASGPSTSEAKRALENHIQAESEGLIKLLDFRKIDGQAREIRGAQCYHLEFEVQIEFAQDCTYPGGGPSFTPFFAMKPRQPAFPQDARYLRRKGQRQQIKGSIELERTENGWRAWKPSFLDSL